MKFARFGRGVVGFWFTSFVAVSAQPQTVPEKEPELTKHGVTPEEEAIILFNEPVRVAAAGHARDVSFKAGGFSIVQSADIVWIADPTTTGLVAVASRPILDTAKAGERMGTRGGEIAHAAAIHLGEESTYVLDAGGTLYVLVGDQVHQATVGTGVASAMDVSANLSGLVFVLWGQRVQVYADPPTQPLWEFDLEPDIRPAIALTVSAKGEIVVAGQGSTAVGVYDVDASGYTRRRSLSRRDLGVASVHGIALSPTMVLPQVGREGWATHDRFLLLSDGDSGTVVALEMATLQEVGRMQLRNNDMPQASPGRLDISNRGQIAYVDLNNSEAHVLPASKTIALIEGARIMWRILDRPVEMLIRGGGAAPADSSRNGG